MYSFAVNKAKLQLSIQALQLRKKLGQPVEITEETVKEEYVKRGGLLAENAPKKK